MQKHTNPQISTALQYGQEEMLLKTNTRFVDYWENCQRWTKQLTSHVATSFRSFVSLFCIGSLIQTFYVIKSLPIKNKLMTLHPILTSMTNHCKIETISRTKNRISDFHKITSSGTYVLFFLNSKYLMKGI